MSLCCTLSPRTVRVVARFSDGERIALAPKRGYLLWVIPARHYPPGHRLATLVTYDADKRRIATERFDPHTHGLYPCPKPRDYGDQVRMCP